MSKENQSVPTEEVDSTAEHAPPGGRRVKRIVLAMGVLVLAAAAAGGTVLLLDRLYAPVREAEEQTAAKAESPHDDEAPLGAASADVDYRNEFGLYIPSPDVAAGGSAGAPSATFKLDPFVVNIADRDRDRYLKVTAELEMSSPEVRQELDHRLPEIRDLLISLLGSKSFEEVRTIEGKNFLREEMLLRINSLLATGQAKRVFFTEFVVQ